MELNLGISTIWMKKVFLLECYQKAKESFQDDNINRGGSINAYRTGIESGLPQFQVLVRFTKKRKDPLLASPQSVLKAEDWCQIKKLLKQVVSDIYDQTVRKLNDTVFCFLLRIFFSNYSLQVLKTLYRMNKRSGSEESLYSFNFKLQRMVMQSFIAPKRLHKHAIFKQRKIKLYGLLKLLKKMLRYVNNKRRKETRFS
jgi:hypothetical protein